MKNIEKTINNGIRFLAKSQARDGSFPSLTSSNPRSFNGASKCQSVFSSALILSCLNALKDFPETNSIKRKTADFLLSQKSEHWTFNYWARESKQAKTMPYPDDLDDTSCALSALYEYNPDLIDGEVLAKAVNVLTALEEKEGGPYRTWLVPPDAPQVWKDIDLAVNNNVAYFLSQHDVVLSGIIKLTESAIRDKEYSSPYYPNKYPIIYFISRWYKGKLRNTIIAQLFEELNKPTKRINPLDTALTVSALLNFDVPHEKVEKGINYLLKMIRRPASNHYWKPYLFYTGINPIHQLHSGQASKKKKYYAGSSTLTTAFCLEALNKFKVESQKFQPKDGPPLAGKVNDSEIKSEEKIYKTVIKKARQRFLSLDTDLRKQVLKILSKTLKGDKDKQIILLPYFFKNSLTPKLNLTVKDDFVVELGLANLYGWMAYTIYDDFLDEEGDPKLLSVANLCLRELTIIFNNLLSREISFTKFANKVLDTIDSANAWEVLNTRCLTNKIPNYGNLSKLEEKSLGHALGPLAILFSLGYKENSREVKALLSFFKHYIIARQLNDDAHDWEEDLKKGHINAVGAQILKKAQSSKSKTKKLDIEKLQYVFWHYTIVDVGSDIIHHIKLAKNDLKKISIIKNTSLLNKLLIPVEGSAKGALKERKEAMKFLKAYK